MKLAKVLIIVFFIMLIKNQEANSQQLSSETKPTVIYFHTDWCSYCKIQSKQIQKDSLLSSIIKTQYNFIEFNAESQEETIFNRKIYKSKKNSTHEFAQSFFPKNKQIAYPAWIILDENNKILFRHEGLIKSKELIELLTSELIKFPRK